MTENKHAITLDTEVQYLKGVGPKRAELLSTLNITCTGELLGHYPRRYLDRSSQIKISDLKIDEDVTVVGKVLSCGIQPGRRSRYMVMFSDGSGMIDCVWFRGIKYIAKVFKVGQTVAFSGKIKQYRGLQLVHPEYDLISDEGEIDPLNTGIIVPMYPSTELLSKVGLDSRGFRRIIGPLLKKIKGRIPDPLPADILKELQLVTLDSAISNIHFPANWQAYKSARKRLAFDELFFIQMLLNLQRKDRQTRQTGLVFSSGQSRADQFIKSLPFQLTSAQIRVIKEIQADTISGLAMNRMLQGDVGSGKTLVAITAMLSAVDSGCQAAIMAPTEILAEQHFLTLKNFLANTNINIALLKGGGRVKAKEKILAGLKDGSVDLVVGTHALVQKGVDFANLGMIIIDEQHRFGVMQRAILRRKGRTPHVLVMTATPIPRTLALTLYGDLDVSIIDEMPRGRLPIKTAWRKEDRRKLIYDFIRKEAAAGRQIYIVYPLVEESEKMDLADATAGWENLSKHVFVEFEVGLLHGRMKPGQKEEIMQQFKEGEIKILVSTTVIEVGVDVPNASVMLIEHAERFGLPQLHQLRGRVGRGEAQSYCILLTQGFLNDTAMSRINTMVKTNDGFRIAETDLEIRGPGQLFGVRQHGDLGLKLANLATDGPLVEAARKAAVRIVESDPHLSDEANKLLKKSFNKRWPDEKMNLIEVG